MSLGSFNATGLTQQQVDSKPELHFVQNLNNYLPNVGDGTTKTVVGSGNTQTGTGCTICGNSNTGTGNNNVILGRGFDTGAFTDCICAGVGDAGVNPSANHMLCLGINTTNAAEGAYSNYKIAVRCFDDAGTPLGVKYISLHDA